MNCPNDKTEMEAGFISSKWTSKAQTKKVFGMTTSNISSELITAYKCPNCGKIELVLETKGDK